MNIVNWHDIAAADKLKGNNIYDRDQRAKDAEEAITAAKNNLEKYKKSFGYRLSQGKYVNCPEFFVSVDGKKSPNINYLKNNLNIVNKFHINETIK